MPTEAFPATPAVGDKTTAAWAAVVAKDAVIMDCGEVSITPSAANTPTLGVVTFNKTFPSAPKVQVSIKGTVPGTVITGCSYNNITTTTVDLYVTRTNTTATTLGWVAVLTH